MNQLGRIFYLLLAETRSGNAAACCIIAVGAGKENKTSV
jgi:hypothetical protein